MYTRRSLELPTQILNEKELSIAPDQSTWMWQSTRPWTGFLPVCFGDGPSIISHTLLRGLARNANEPLSSATSQSSRSICSGLAWIRSSSPSSDPKPDCDLNLPPRLPPSAFVFSSDRALRYSNDLDPGLTRFGAGHWSKQMGQNCRSGKKTRISS